MAQIHKIVFLLCISRLVQADLLGTRRFPRRSELPNEIQGSAIDFSKAVPDEATGKLCVTKESEVESIAKEPILECTHKNVEKCHYTYVTQFKPAQEEVCDESFEKLCQITFKQQAVNETLRKCYTPVQKVCNGQGPEKCRTVFESACTTRYLEKAPGKFIGDTKCEKLPIEVCGAGCITEEGPEECHDKVVTSLLDVPDEICDLNPQKTCKLETRLVPSLVPKHECTVIPREVCHMKFTAPKVTKKPLLTKWCLSDEAVSPGQTYQESEAAEDPIKSNSGDLKESSTNDYEVRSYDENKLPQYTFDPQANQLIL